MAKKALIAKAARKPKFGVRAYTPASAAVVPTPCTASSACAASAFVRWLTVASCRA
jgi:hypothetical protein